MKKILTLTILMASMFAVAAQPNLFTGSLTNGEMITTYSNGIATSTEPLRHHRHLVDNNGDVVPDAMLALISSNTGIPESLLKIIPPKVIVWGLLIYFGYPSIARKLRKILPDRWQTGDFGVILANLSDEINPSKAKLAVAAAAPGAPPVIAVIPEVTPKPPTSVMVS